MRIAVTHNTPGVHCYDSDYGRQRASLTIDNRKGLMLLGVDQSPDLEAFRPGDIIAVPDRLPALPQRLSTLDDLTAGYLIRFRPATRQAYQGDLASWLTFCDQTHIDPLTAGIHHADTYVRVLDELGDPRTGRQLSPASISRRVSAVAGFYRYAVRQRAVAESPFFAIERPGVDEESQTTGLTRDEMRRLMLVSRQAGPGSEALMHLLALNGLRITEALSRDVEDLDYDQGHRILRLERKGGKRAKAPLTRLPCGLSRPTSTGAATDRCSPPPPAGASTAPLPTASCAA